MKFIFIIVVMIFILSCTTEEKNPCKDVTCSNHGECKEINNRTFCICEPGYFQDGLSCINPCKDVTCSNHGLCGIENNVAKCNCNEGFKVFDLKCLDKNDLCSGVTCSNHGVCSVENENPKCSCETGYTDNKLECDSLCENYSCGVKESCKMDSSNNPICDCSNGYMMLEGNCLSCNKKDEKFILNTSGESIIDILFVIDNSGTMAEEQTKLVENISKFIEKLKKSSEKTSYHIGIITASVFAENQALGTENSPNIKGARIKLMEDGKLTPIVTGDPTSFPSGANPDYSSCDAARTNGKIFLSNADNATIVKDLKNTIKCLGLNGALIERPFDAIEKALTRDENIGFLRDDAKLMIIVVSDEDDCSTGLDSSDFVIHSSRYFDCVEQSDSIEKADTLIRDNNERGKQNKVKPLEYYLNMLKDKKDSWDKIGFASIVGPNFCWNGDINSMGANYDNIPTPALNCRYINAELKDEYSNYTSCNTGAYLPCGCNGESGEQECVPQSFFTSCFNNLSTGIPNEVPIIDMENSCSDTSLNGFCEDGKHCEVTTAGVKCVNDSCSDEHPNGTCPADKLCKNGICSIKIRSEYSNTPRTISSAIPGRRYLDFYKLLSQKKQNTKDLYKYSICLEDFGTPLSFIGSKLTRVECGFNLINRTNDPCNLILNISYPDDKTTPEIFRGDLTLGEAWSYKIIKGAVVDSSKYRAGEVVTPKLLKEICKQDIGKDFTSRDGISQYLKRVECSISNRDKRLPTEKLECFGIIFPEECPFPGSEVNISSSLCGAY